jgi:hypothetical protein
MRPGGSCVSIICCSSSNLFVLIVGRRQSREREGRSPSQPFRVVGSFAAHNPAGKGEFGETPGTLWVRVPGLPEPLLQRDFATAMVLIGNVLRVVLQYARLSHYCERSPKLLCPVYPLDDGEERPCPIPLSSERASSNG